MTIKVTDRLPEKGSEVLAYTKQGGWTVCRFTDRNWTHGYHYKEAWFTKSGRQMSKKVTHWAELPAKPDNQ